MRLDEELDDFLTARGLRRDAGPDAPRLQHGRNQNWLVTTCTGRDVFVKKVATGSPQARARLEACVLFDDVLGTNPAVAQLIRTPRIIAVDTDRGFLVLEAVAEARDAAHAVSDDDLPEDFPADAGRTLAALHALDVATGPISSEPHHMPPVEWLAALPWHLYANASAPQLEVWRRLQGDAELRTALVALRTAEACAPLRPLHGDVRLDQFLVTPDGSSQLVDFEEFRLGDAARDVGAFVGEWLHRAVLDLNRDDEDSGAELDHEEVLARGARSLARRQPLISAFWQAYTTVAAAGGRTLDSGFADRAAAFAGWHLLDRLIAAAENRSRLSAFEWAGAGIGRQALLQPRNTAIVLGLVPATPDDLPAPSVPTTVPHVEPTAEPTAEPVGPVTEGIPA